MDIVSINQFIIIFDYAFNNLQNINMINFIFFNLDRLNISNLINIF